MRLVDGSLSNELLPADMNDGSFVFLPVGAKEYDRDLSSEGVCGAPLDLLPPTFKNSDNQIEAGHPHWMIKPVVETDGCTFQNRFDAGRQVIQNVAGLDCESICSESSP